MRSRFAALTMAVLLPLAACDSDDPLAVGDPLTDEEAAALGEVLMSQSYQSSSGSMSGAQAPAAAPSAVPISGSSTIDAPCRLGGTVHAEVTVSGDVDQEAGTADVDISQVLSHTDCSAPHEQTDLIFTLNGDPTATFEANVMMENGTDFTYTGTLDGDVSWTTDDDREGGCKVHLEFTITGSAESSFSADVAGNVCEAEISRSLSIGAT